MDQEGKLMTFIIPESELVLNEQGGIYHLGIRPEELADTIITVGDPQRVPEVAKYFDSIELEKQHREFAVKTGYIGKKRVTALSTGMGSDNIDIVLNELDILCNVDLETRKIKNDLRQLTIVRMGTCGTLQQMPMDTIVVSDAGICFGTLRNFYQYQVSQNEINLANAFKAQLPEESERMSFYASQGDRALVDHFASLGTRGYTLTCVGFYAPQSRKIRANLAFPELFNHARAFEHEGVRVANFEMETAAIYAMANVFGHRACSMSTVIIDRINKKFTPNLEHSVENLLEKGIERLLEF